MNKNDKNILMWALIAFIIVIFGLLILGGCLTAQYYRDPVTVKAEPIETAIKTTAKKPVNEVDFEKIPLIKQKQATLTDDEIIARVVMAEAEGEPFIGKVAVASVILNRCEYYGLTVESVVYEPNQFAITNSYVDDDCYKAVDFAKQHRDLFPSRMFYFRADKYHDKNTMPNYSTECEDYTVIGNHYFSIKKGEF